MNFVQDYFNVINARTLALRKIQLVKQIEVRHKDQVSYMNIQTIEYDPLVKALYNTHEYSDSELEQLEFLNSPIFMSMN